MSDMQTPDTERNQILFYQLMVMVAILICFIVYVVRGSSEGSVTSDSGSMVLVNDKPWKVYEVRDGVAHKELRIVFLNGQAFVLPEPDKK